jgi:hypothetical protein
MAHGLRGHEGALAKLFVFNNICQDFCVAAFPVIYSDNQGGQFVDTQNLKD